MAYSQAPAANNPQARINYQHLDTTKIGHSQAAQFLLMLKALLLSKQALLLSKRT